MLQLVHKEGPNWARRRRLTTAAAASADQAQSSRQHARMAGGRHGSLLPQRHELSTQLLGLS